VFESIFPKYRLRCDFCRNLINPPKPPDSPWISGVFLIPIPEELLRPASLLSWARRGCDWKIEFEPVRWNAKQLTTPWWPPFSWYDNPGTNRGTIGRRLIGVGRVRWWVDVDHVPKEPQISAEAWKAIAAKCPGLGRRPRCYRNSPTLHFSIEPEPDYFSELTRSNNEARAEWIKKYDLRSITGRDHAPNVPKGKEFKIREFDKKINIPSGLAPGAFTRAVMNFFKLTPYIRKRLIWATSRGSVSYHEQRGQIAGRCYYCGGEVRYDEHLARICSECSTFHGYSIVTDHFMNMGGDEEESGDDDSWKGDELQSFDGDLQRLEYNRTNWKRQQRLERILKETQEEKWREEDRKIKYIPSDSRKMKTGFLDYKIGLLLDGNGVEQAEIGKLLEQKFNTAVTPSAIKTAIRRMEASGRVETADTYTKHGKRIFVRSIAKT
jgi:hypothetical protein